MSIYVLLETSILPGCRNKNLAKLRDSLLFILKWHLRKVGNAQLEAWEGSSHWAFFNQCGAAYHLRHVISRGPY